MDCKELRRDITKLKRLFDEVGFEERQDSLSAFKSFYLKTKEAAKYEENVLKKYLGDFLEHNPEAFFRLSDPVCEFDDAGHNFITNMIPLSDGSLFVCGVNMQHLYIAKKFENGEWSKECINVRNPIVVPSSFSIFFSTHIDDETYYIGGSVGEHYLLRKDNDGWFIDEEGSKELMDNISPNVDITCSLLLPNGDLLFAGPHKYNDEFALTVAKKEASGYLVCYDYRYEAYGHFVRTFVLPDQKVLVLNGDHFLVMSYDDVDGLRDEDYIWLHSDKMSKVISLSDGTVLVGGDGGVYELKKNDDGRWELGDKIDDRSLDTMCEISDNGIFCSGYSDSGFLLSKKENGDWEKGSMTTMRGGGINAIARTSDGSVMCATGGFSPKLRQLSTEVSFESLKAGLKSIAKKREVKA